MGKDGLAKVKQFIEEHKKPILIGGVLVAGAIAVIVCKALGQSEPEPYTTRWYEGLTDDEWQEEREKTRLAMRGTCGELADEMYFRLKRFDDEWSRRKDDGTDYHGPSLHREHGNNLYKPD